MILNISEAANLAIHAMAYLVNHQPEQPVASGKVAGYLEVSGAHLNKVLQRLKKAGLVRSVRGPAGGFSLAQEPAEVTMLQIYEAIDGPLPRHSCLLGQSSCLFGNCVFGKLLTSVGAQVDEQLSGTTLADLRN